MSSKIRAKRRPATPLMPRRAPSRRKKQEDAGFNESIEIFRDHHDDTPMPILKPKILLAKKTRPAKSQDLKPEEKNYLNTFLLSDNETSPKPGQVHGIACSTPVEDGGIEHFPLFMNVSVILVPSALELKAETTSDGGVKVVDLRRTAEEVAESRISDKTGDVNPETGKEVQIIDLTGDSPAAESGFERPSVRHPICPLANLAQTQRLRATVRVRRNPASAEEGRRRRPHEYPQCPLEVSSFATKKPKRATLRDEPL